MSNAIDNANLKTYREFRPTAFDARGLGCEDRQTWLVGPCSRTRDSGTLERANFDALVQSLEAIDPDGTDHEVHRFGHWGPGWFEIVLVRPDSKAHEEAAECACALENYPVLSDDLYSQYESEEGSEQ